MAALSPCLPSIRVLVALLKVAARAQYLQVFRAIGSAAAQGHHVVDMVFSLALRDNDDSARGALPALLAEDPRYVRAGVAAFGGELARPSSAVGRCRNPRMGCAPPAHVLQQPFRVLLGPLARSLSRFFPVRRGVLSALLAVLFWIGAALPRRPDPRALSARLRGGPCGCARPVPIGVFCVTSAPCFEIPFAILLAVLLPQLGIIFSILGNHFPVRFSILAIVFADPLAVPLAVPLLVFAIANLLFWGKLSYSHSVCSFRSLVRAASMLKHRHGPLPHYTSNLPKIPVNAGVSA